MSMNTNTPFAILSAEHGHFTKEVNAGRTEALRSQLESRGAAFAPVAGYYKGVHEQSFIVLLPEGEGSYTFDLVRQLAYRYSQESVLYVDANRIASLHNPSERSTEPATIIGRWTTAGDPDAARRLDAWTYYPRTQQYYVVVPL